MTPHIIRDETMRAAVCRLISALDLTKEWSVTVEPYKKHRSLSQNNLMWLWNSIIARETGDDVDWVHETLKKKFLPLEERECLGEVVSRRATRTLNTEKMTEYLNRVQAFAASELGILLPVPEDEKNE